MSRMLATIALIASLIFALSAPALASSPVVFDQIWLDGVKVRTLLPPAATPKEGTDAFYMVPGTGGVAAVGPGDVGYHGGHWKVFVVSWKVTPRLLTSVTEILAAEKARDITIKRNAAADFLCPIQP